AHASQKFFRSLDMFERIPKRHHVEISRAFCVGIHRLQVLDGFRVDVEAAGIKAPRASAADKRAGPGADIENTRAILSMARNHRHTPAIKRIGDLGTVISGVAIEVFVAVVDAPRLDVSLKCDAIALAEREVAVLELVEGC